MLKIVIFFTAPIHLHFLPLFARSIPTKKKLSTKNFDINEINEWR